MDQINLSEYYKTNHYSDFLECSRNLIYRSGMKQFIENYEVLVSKDFTEKNNSPDTSMKLMNELINNVDEFNFFIIRLSIGLEMALKGLFLYHQYNIFVIEDEKLIKIESLKCDLTTKKTLKFDFFINNLKNIKDSFLEYQRMFKFFQQRRNEYIHFAKNKYTYSHKEIVGNIMKLNDFMKKEVISVLDVKK